MNEISPTSSSKRSRTMVHVDSGGPLNGIMTVSDHDDSQNHHLLQYTVVIKDDPGSNEVGSGVPPPTLVDDDYLYHPTSTMTAFSDTSHDSFLSDSAARCGHELVVPHHQQSTAQHMIPPRGGGSVGILQQQHSPSPWGDVSHSNANILSSANRPITSNGVGINGKACAIGPESFLQNIAPIATTPPLPPHHHPTTVQAPPTPRGTTSGISSFFVLLRGLIESGRNKTVTLSELTSRIRSCLQYDRRRAKGGKCIGYSASTLSKCKWAAMSQDWTSLLSSALQFLSAQLDIDGTVYNPCIIVGERAVPVSEQTKRRIPWGYPKDTSNPLVVGDPTPLLGRQFSASYVLEQTLHWVTPHHPSLNDDLDTLNAIWLKESVGFDSNHPQPTLNCSSNINHSNNTTVSSPPDPDLGQKEGGATHKEELTTVVSIDSPPSKPCSESKFSKVDTEKSQKNDQVQSSATGKQTLCSSDKIEVEVPVTSRSSETKETSMSEKVVGGIAGRKQLEPTVKTSKQYPRSVKCLNSQQSPPFLTYDSPLFNASDLQMFHSEEAERFSKPRHPFTYRVRSLDASNNLTKMGCYVVGPVLKLATHRRFTKNVDCIHFPLLNDVKPLSVSHTGILVDAMCRLPGGKGNVKQITTLFAQSKFLRSPLNFFEVENCVYKLLERLENWKASQQQTQQSGINEFFTTSIDDIDDDILSFVYDDKTALWTYLHSDRTIDEWMDLHKGKRNARQDVRYFRDSVIFTRVSGGAQPASCETTSMLRPVGRIATTATSVIAPSPIGSNRRGSSNGGTSAQTSVIGITSGFTEATATSLPQPSQILSSPASSEQMITSSSSPTSHSTSLNSTATVRNDEDGVVDGASGDDGEGNNETLTVDEDVQEIVVVSGVEDTLADAILLEETPGNHPSCIGPDSVKSREDATVVHIGEIGTSHEEEIVGSY